MSDNVIYVNKDNFNDIMSREGLIVIDFYADWCGPCKMLAPVIDKLADDYVGKCTICKCNVDENREITESFKVATIPTLFFIKDKRAFDKTVGVVSPAKIISIIDNNL